MPNALTAVGLRPRGRLAVAAAGASICRLRRPQEGELSVLANAAGAHARASRPVGEGYTRPWAIRHTVT
jgi:hypothetical protein